MKISKTGRKRWLLRIWQSHASNCCPRDALLFDSGVQCASLHEPVGSAARFWTAPSSGALIISETAEGAAVQDAIALGRSSTVPPNSEDAPRDLPSPLGGERVRVRGEAPLLHVRADLKRRFHPPRPSPLGGEREHRASFSCWHWRVASVALHGLQLHSTSSCDVATLAAKINRSPNPNEL